MYVSAYWRASGRNANFSATLHWTFFMLWRHNDECWWSLTFARTTPQGGLKKKTKFTLFLLLACDFTFKHVCIQVCMYACVCVFIYLCMYVCLYVCMFACMFVCMYACTYICSFMLFVSSSFLFPSETIEMDRSMLKTNGVLFVGLDLTLS